MILLVGAGLLVRSFLVAAAGAARLRRGRRAHLPARAAGGPLSHAATSRRTFVRELERRLGELPGRRAASAIISKLPLTGSGSLSPYAFDEATARNWESVTADGRPVSPDYFATMNTRLLAGRPFTWDDAVGQAAGDHHRRDARPPGLAGPERRGQAAPARAHGRGEQHGRGGRRRGARAKPRSDARRAAAHLLLDGPADPGRAGRRDRDRRRARRASPARRRGWCTRWTRTWRSPGWRRWRSTCPRAWRRPGSASC